MAAGLPAAQAVRGSCARHDQQIRRHYHFTRVRCFRSEKNKNVYAPVPTAQVYGGDICTTLTIDRSDRLAIDEPSIIFLIWLCLVISAVNTTAKDNRAARQNRIEAGRCRTCARSPYCGSTSRAHNAGVCAYRPPGCHHWPMADRSSDIFAFPVVTRQQAPPAAALKSAESC